MREALRIICLITRRAADVDGDVLTLGRMSPDLRIFRAVFPAQHSGDPWLEARNWITSGTPYAQLPVSETA